MGKFVILMVGAIELMFLLSVETVQAQQTNTYTDGWFMMANHVELNYRWVLGNEFHWRKTHFLKQKEKLLIRPFVTYRGNKVDYSAGYSYIASYPFKSEAIQGTKPEHNFWEQIELRQHFGKLLLKHRYRMEHRFQGVLTETSNTPIIDDYSFSNRLRYRLTLKRSIGGNYFIHVFNELWIRTSNTFDSGQFDRNWFYVGMGRKMNDVTSLQLAYLHQSIKVSDSIYERHPTVQLTLQLDFLK